MVDCRPATGRLVEHDPRGAGQREAPSVTRRLDRPAPLFVTSIHPPPLPPPPPERSIIVAINAHLPSPPPLFSPLPPPSLFPSLFLPLSPLPPSLSVLSPPPPLPPLLLPPPLPSASPLLSPPPSLPSQPSNISASRSPSSSHPPSLPFGSFCSAPRPSPLHRCMNPQTTSSLEPVATRLLSTSHHPPAHDRVFFPAIPPFLSAPSLPSATQSLRERSH